MSNSNILEQFLFSLVVRDTDKDYVCGNATEFLFCLTHDIELCYSYSPEDKLLERSFYLESNDDDSINYETIFLVSKGNSFNIKELRKEFTEFLSIHFKNEPTCTFKDLLDINFLKAQKQTSNMIDHIYIVEQTKQLAEHIPQMHRLYESMSCIFDEERDLLKKKIYQKYGEHNVLDALFPNNNWDSLKIKQLLSREDIDNFNIFNKDINDRISFVRNYISSRSVKNLIKNIFSISNCLSSSLLSFRILIELENIIRLNFDENQDYQKIKISFNLNTGISLP